MKEQTQHHIKSIVIERLKCVRDLDLSLEDKNVTAILGRNGSGKSTVLQALYCLYRPQGKQYAYYDHRKEMNQLEEIPDSKFSHFFKQVDGTRWTDSMMYANMQWREGETIIENIRIYKKLSERWSPRMVSKPEREIYYLGVNTCVPAIEKAIKGRVTYQTKQTNELQHAQEICAAACRIMGYPYDQVFYSNETNRLFFNVERNGQSMHAFALGAGEQRLFTILETIYNAGKYALIAIDELDLTLHTAALLRLIDEMVGVANEKKLQIVFTTHRQEVMSRKDINVRYLMQTEEKTLCINDPNAICYEELTGTHERDLTIWVEDLLSKTIIEKVLEERDMSRRAEIRIFGSIENSFTLAGYYQIAKYEVTKLLIVTDGDRYTTEEEKIAQVKRAIIGNRECDNEARAEAIKIMRQYNTPDKYAPEKFIHSAICAHGQDTEIKRVALQIVNPDDKHGFVDEILEKMHWGREKYYRVVDEFAKCPEWEEYTRGVNDWLESVR